MSVTRSEINSNFYQIVVVDSNGLPVAILPEYIANSSVAYANEAGVADTANNALSLTANISNVSITGGLDGYILQTDGSGNLSWTPQTGGGGGGTPGGANTQLQYNNNGSFGGISTTSFNGTKLTLGETTNISILGGNNKSLLQTDGSGNLSWADSGNIININLDGSSSNVLYGNGVFAPASGSGNVANANYANFAGTAYSVSGANVSGAVANATYANTSGTANSVAVANVSGIGNIATINLDGASSNVLYGNGVFAPVAGGSGNSISNGNTSVSIPDVDGNIDFTVNTVPMGRLSPNKIAIGSGAGNASQSTGSISIGTLAGSDAPQGTDAIAIGTSSGLTNQGEKSIALGYHSGSTNQGGYTGGAVAIGQSAGQDNQGSFAVAIGSAGGTTQGSQAVAIGKFAGDNTQGSQSIAIGSSAGQYSQGSNSIAIGSLAGQTSQANNSIILNATDSALDQTTANSFTVKPIRQANTANALYYDSTTGEITFDVAGTGGGNVFTDLTVNNTITLDGLSLYNQGGYFEAAYVSPAGNIATSTALAELINFTSNTSVENNIGNVPLTVVGDLSTIMQSSIVKYSPYAWQNLTASGPNPYLETENLSLSVMDTNPSWTIDMWFYYSTSGSNTTSALINTYGYGQGGTFGLILYYELDVAGNYTVRLDTDYGNFIIGSTSGSGWYHVGLMKSNKVTYGLFNGVVTPLVGNPLLRMPAYNMQFLGGSSYSTFSAGVVDNIRISKSYALFPVGTGTYTLPVSSDYNPTGTVHVEAVNNPAINYNDLANLPTLGNVSSLNLDGSGSTVLYGNGVFGAIGNIATINLDGNVSNVLAGDGTWIAAGGGGGGGSSISNGTSNVSIATSNGNVDVFVGGNATARAIFTTTGSNFAGTLSVSGNANVGNIGTGILTATGTINSANTITGTRLISNIATGTAPLVVTSTTQVANLNVANAGYASLAGVVVTNAQPNITSVGTLSSLAINNNVTATRFTSNVATGLAPFVVTSTTQVANLNVANAGYATTAGSATTAGTVTTNAQPNITSLGTLTSVSVSGNANVGNLNITSSFTTPVVTANKFTATGGITSTSNALFTGTQSWNNVSATYNAFLINVTDSLSAANSTLLDLQESSVSKFSVNKVGNVAFSGSITGNGSGLSSIAGANVTGNVANATLSYTSNITSNNSNSTFYVALASGNGAQQLSIDDTGSIMTYNPFTGNLTVNTVVGNVTGTAGSATTASTAGTVTTNAQPNITSVGTLTSVTTSGTAGAKLVSLVGGTVTTSTNILTGSQTWNNANATFNSMLVNITDTASSNNSTFVDFQTNSVSKFSVSKLGNINFSGNLSTTGNINTGNIIITGAGSSGYNAISTGPSGYTALPSTTIQVTGNGNTYVQMNQQNINTGTQATTEYVATADNGTDTTFFVDMGIAGSGYSNSSPNNSLGTSLYPRDSYLYSQGNSSNTSAVGGNLVIGTTTSTKNIKFISGGINDANIAVIMNNPQDSSYTLKTFGETYVSSNNSHGGANFAGVATWENTSSGATNGKKYWRINQTGTLEMINNAYSQNIFGISDSGTVSGYSGFIAGAGAASGVALEMPAEGAIRYTGNNTNNSMYFDAGTGGTNGGTFKFRGSNSYTTYGELGINGWLSRTPYLGKTSFNVALDTEVSVDNLKYRISNQSGTFPQVASVSGSSVDICWSIYGVVSGAGLTSNQSSGSLITSFASLYTTHGLDTRGDTLTAHITDKSAGKIYRVTFLVTNNSSNTTGYNILVERLI